MESKAVVLFSGGLDSLACYYWAKDLFGKENITLLYCYMATKFSVVELNFAENFALKEGVVLEKVLFDHLGSLEDSAGHIPLRNLFLIELASLYGDTVLFGMLHGELSEDKGFPFIRRMERLLRTQRQNNLYHDKSEFEILTPFANKTKTQVVKFLLDRNLSPEYISESIGCMNGTRCGQCPPCFNRWVAFENNGIGDIETYTEHPLSWGLAEVIRSKQGSGMFKKSIVKVSFLKKRKWFLDVWRAYKMAYTRKLIDIPPSTLLKHVIRAYRNKGK